MQRQPVVESRTACRLAVVRLSIGALLLSFSSLAALAGEAGWIELETDSFRTLSQVSERKSREILRQLQVFQSALGNITNFPVAAPRVPTRIFLLGEDSFRRATEGMQDVAGVFIGRPFRNEILIDASRPTDLSLLAVYHEYVHFHANNHGHHGLPVFYEEGLAQFAQYFRVDDRKYHFGFFPRGLVPHARSEAMPLEQVLSVDRGSEEYRDHRYRTTFYARSLLFLHYCLVGKRDSRDALLRFVARRSNGEPVTNAFEQEFGKTTRQLDRELDAYALRAHERHAWMPASSLPRPPSPRVRRIAREDANVQFALLLLRDSQSGDGAETLLAPKLASSPDFAPALVALALWHEGQARSAEADGLIERVAGLPDVVADDLTRAAFILLERARANEESSSPGAGANTGPLHRSRHLFERALALDPDSPEAAFGYGVTQMLAPDDIATGLRIVSAAAQRFPESGELQVLRAVHLEMSGRKEEARGLLFMAACKVIDDGMRAYVTRELGNVTCAKHQ